MIDRVLKYLASSAHWRGAILLLTALGVKLEPDLQNAIIAAGLGAVGLINVLRKGQ